MKPLINQILDYKKDQQERKENQRMLANHTRTLIAILKFPRLSDIYRRTNKSRMSKSEHRNFEQ